MIPGLLGIIPGLLGIIPGLFGANILGLLLIQPQSLCGIIPGSLGFFDPRWLAPARTVFNWLAMARACCILVVQARAGHWLARASCLVLTQ